MRLDLFLYRIRLARTRSMVQRQLADMPVRLDGRRVVKPSTEVRVGQVLVLPFHGRVEVFEILSLPERRGPVAEAKSHVRAISRTFGQLTGTGADA